MAIKVDNFFQKLKLQLKAISVVIMSVSRFSHNTVESLHVQPVLGPPVVTLMDVIWRSTQQLWITQTVGCHIPVCSVYGDSKDSC